LGKLLSRRVPIANFEEALARQTDDVKVVIEIGN
jgi:hypothetical protein